MQGFEEPPFSYILSSHQGPPEYILNRETQNRRLYAAAKEAIRRLNSPDLGMNQLKEHYRDGLDIFFDELVGKASKRNIRLLRKHFVDNGISFCSHEFVDAVFGHGLIHYEKELVFQIHGIPSRSDLTTLLGKMKTRNQRNPVLGRYQLHKFEYFDDMLQDVVDVGDGEQPLHPGCECFFEQMFNHHLELLVLILKN